MRRVGSSLTPELSCKTADSAKSHSVRGFQDQMFRLKAPSCTVPVTCHKSFLGLLRKPLPPYDG
ncbi:hypothetical protein DXC92_26370 [Clostridiales bacterium TF09-2AC]|nr:hypothetical protein DXC92_26370 [Clostridiales bacterium TF09-2AC]